MGDCRDLVNATERAAAGPEVLPDRNQAWNRLCKLGNERTHSMQKHNNGIVLRGSGEKGTVQTIAEWLASLGLAEYAQRFAEHQVDVSVLPDLTDQDLIELGLPLGHRRKLLRAIAELDGNALAPAEASTEPVPRDEAERRAARRSRPRSR